jgi:hypothetical protein
VGIGMAGGSKRIHGTTWDVYLCIFTSKEPLGVREIWRKLDLSSPSLAQYHVNKLLELDLIESTPEGYCVTSEEVEALRYFLRLRGRLVPRLVIYGGFTLGILIAYFLFWPFRGDFRDFVTLVVCVGSTLGFFAEARSQYMGLRAYESRAVNARRNTRLRRESS